MSRGLVILLHGVGSHGAAFAPVIRQWSTQRPDLAFAAPDAPFAFDHAPMGRQWFSIQGVTDTNRAERVASARATFDTTLLACMDDAGLTGQPERMVLVGFSQGSIMALDAVVSGRWPVAGVVAFSGRLASPLPYTPALHTPVLLVHGDADPIMPVKEAARAAQALEQAGVAVKTVILPGVEHTLSAEGVAQAAAFIHTCLPPASAEPLA
ncbi:alpha/beta hydrolase [Acetobacter papayae]|uniref:alpha/beta hydrolase n=1 Tax=Acetobacter papayae TaxID=1076592 RepID=UPI0039EB14EC